jgi:hypothetical protein
VNGYPKEETEPDLAVSSYESGLFTRHLLTLDGQYVCEVPAGEKEALPPGGPWIAAQDTKEGVVLLNSQGLALYSETQKHCPIPGQQYCQLGPADEERIWLLQCYDPTTRRLTSCSFPEPIRRLAKDHYLAIGCSGRIWGADGSEILTPLPVVACYLHEFRLYILARNGLLYRVERQERSKWRRWRQTYGRWFRARSPAALRTQCIEYVPTLSSESIT